MSNKFTAVLVAMTAAVALSACSGGDTADPLAASKARDAEQQTSIKPSRFLPPNADLTAFDDAGFRAAMDAGAPFIYGVTGGGTAICQTGVVVPANSSAMGTWFLSGVVPVSGAAMTREIRDVSSCSGAVLPNQVPDRATSVDTTAQAAAKQAGVPFLYAEPGECGTVVVLPSGAAWVMNRRGPAPVAGRAMSTEQYPVGCGAGYGNPGGN
ncbi:hypothetical protein [Mycolicibacterium llatzerense]|uniref:hypothetical protein n=1 Tax=Mycolicibacterium llatzerense TaxID=280871 RepID=UPI0008DD154E|nr:hypothetical protein [Mycolicibacterium llatzerense]